MVTSKMLWKPNGKRRRGRGGAWSADDSIAIYELIHPDKGIEFFFFDLVYDNVQLDYLTFKVSLERWAVRCCGSPLPPFSTYK